MNTYYKANQLYMRDWHVGHVNSSFKNDLTLLISECANHSGLWHAYYYDFETGIACLREVDVHTHFNRDNEFTTVLVSDN